MTVKPAHPDLASHLRRLLEAVKEACAVEGRWGWLAGPMALLTWVRTRRERREAAEAMQAFQGLVEAFLTMLEDFRAGRLPECARLEADAEGGVRSRLLTPHPSPPRRVPLRCAQWGPDQGGREKDARTPRRCVCLRPPR